MRISLLLLLFTALLLVPAMPVHADIKGDYDVREIVGPDKICIAFHGLPVIVRLAHVKASPEAQAMLQELLKDQEVSIRFAKELGADDDGVPYVNMAFGPALKRQIVNVELVNAGVADYDTSKAKSASYDKQLAAALSTAKSGKLGMWASQAETVAAAAETPEPKETKAVQAPAPKPVKQTKALLSDAETGAIAEINARFYHLPTCPIARGLSKRNLVKYASPDAADRAGKRPCARCLKERSRSRGARHQSQSVKKTLPGKLIGLISDPRFFYSPVAPQLKDVNRNDMIGFNTVKEAKATGRKPDPISLRLTSLPGYPAEPPAPGECMGRALPFYRPCRRDAADESGLCLECQRGE